MVFVIVIVAIGLVLLVGLVGLLNLGFFNSPGKPPRTPNEKIDKFTMPFVSASLWIVAIIGFIIFLWIMGNIFGPSGLYDEY